MSTTDPAELKAARKRRYRKSAASSPPPPSLGSWLSFGQVQAAIGVSPRHLERLIANGQFPKPVRFGKIRRWREGVVSDHLKQLELQAAAG